MKDILAEIITIGDEILYGQITDTNSQWISGALDEVGVRTVRKSSVADDAPAIRQVLDEAARRADIVLLTGGLGPTKDDVTKKTLTEYFGSELVLNEDALRSVETFFAQRGRALTELNRQQALQPAAATYLPNPVGTAPGMWFERDGRVFASMPGVPHEMKEMVRKQIIPRLREHFQTPVIYHRIVRTVGIGESFLADKIEAWADALPDNIRLAYLPSLGQVRLRLTATGPSVDALREQVRQEVEKLHQLVPKYIFGYDRDELEQHVGQLLAERGQTVAVAESCTGGFVGHLITKVPGSSAYFRGGVIAYDNALKQEALGVPVATLADHGAVSEATVVAMAEGGRRRFGTDVGLASSGVAGPGGGTPDKPVGTIWIAVADADGTVARKLQLVTDRQLNIRLTGLAVLNLLRLRLKGYC